MKDMKRDVIISLMFLTGIFGFISGEFIFSTVIFAVASLYTNIAINRDYHHQY